MSLIELTSPAKINLSLDVLRKRPDGYHDVQMIMQAIALHDKVTIESTDGGIDVSCNSQWVPDGSGNIAYKAAELFMNEYNIKKGVRIKVDKRIPVSAGLAGGSSNAAAVLKGLNHLFGVGLADVDLMVLGGKIGADVPFCIQGGTMLAEGIGDKLTELSPLPVVPIVLVKPRIGVSTPWVYKNLNLQNVTQRPDTHALIQAIEDKQVDVLANKMVNVLETVTIAKYDVIRHIKEKLMNLGAVGSMMSGSGPSVFGIFNSKQEAKEAYRKLRNYRWDVFVTETLCKER